MKKILGNRLPSYARIETHEMVDKNNKIFGSVLKINNSQIIKTNEESAFSYRKESSKFVNNYISSKFSHLKKGLLVFSLSQTLTDDRNIPIAFHEGHSMFHFTNNTSFIDNVAEANPISWTYFGSKGAYFQNRKDVQSRILSDLYPTFSTNFGIKELIFSTFSSQFLVVIDLEHTIFGDKDHLLDRIKSFKNWFSEENGSKNKSNTRTDFLSYNSCGNAILQFIVYYLNLPNSDILNFPLPPFSTQTAITYAAKEILRNNDHIRYE